MQEVTTFLRFSLAKRPIRMALRLTGRDIYCSGGLITASRNVFLCSISRHTGKHHQLSAPPFGHLSRLQQQTAIPGQLMKKSQQSSAKPRQSSARPQQQTAIPGQHMQEYTSIGAYGLLHPKNEHPSRSKALLREGCGLHASGLDAGGII